MMNGDDDVLCNDCGANMLPGIPGELYCPNPDCMDKDRQRAMRWLRERIEREERAELARLKAKYEGDEK